MKIYHNPMCSKSREALKYITDKGLEVEVVKYLKEIPTREEFEMILMKLNLKASDVLRKSERLYKDKYADKNFTEEEWITVMLQNPKLIERPIIVDENKAVIARPIKNLEELLNR